MNQPETVGDPCGAVLATLRRGEVLAPEVESHAQSCATCTELRAGGAALRPPTLEGLSDAEAAELLARARQAVGAEKGFLGELRSLRTGLRVAIAVTALALVALVVGGLGARPDLVTYPPGRLLLSLVCLLASFLAATSLALRPPFRQPSRLETAGILLALGVPVFLALLPEVETGLAVSGPGESGEFLPRAVACLVGGALFSLPVFLAIFALARVTWRTRTLLAAAAAGLGGVLGLELHCPTTSSMHLLFGHATVVLTMVLAAGAVVSLRRA